MTYLINIYKAYLKFIDEDAACTGGSADKTTQHETCLSTDNLSSDVDKY